MGGREVAHITGCTYRNIVHFQSEAALAQSDFNIEKITEIQNKFAGGMVSMRHGEYVIRQCYLGIKNQFALLKLFAYVWIGCHKYKNWYLAYTKLGVHQWSIHEH